MGLFEPSVNDQAYLKAGFFGQQGSGKAQPVSEPVLTPRGFVQMRDIKAGDCVLASDGDAYPVLGVFAQGQKRVSKIRFVDGTWTRCCDDHLWIVQRTGRLDRWHILPAKEIKLCLEDLHARGTKRLRIPVAHASQFSGSGDLPLHPYTLGCLLGDGCFRGKGITFSTADPEIIANMLQHSPELGFTKLAAYDYYVRNCVQTIRELGLHGCDSGSKFIPPAYLWSCVESRLALLQGLCDTDGSRNHGYVDVTLKSRALAEGVVFLARSLGYLAKLHTRKAPKRNRILAFWKEGKSHREIASLVDATEASVATTICDAKHRPLPECGPFYRALIYCDDTNDLIRLSRKQGVSRTGKYSPNRMKIIKDIEPDGFEECRCIAVGSPDNTYLTRDFIVTHNTYTGSSVVIGLHQYLRDCGQPEGSNPILFADTETGSAWVANRFAEAGITLEVAKTRAFKNLRPMIQEAEARKCILLIDSLTHFWGELIATYLKSKKRQRLVFSDWQWLKGPDGNGAFSEAYTNSQAHIVWCARAGFSYSYFENEAGQKELEQTGVKPKAETESGYEPSLLVMMSRWQDFDPEHMEKTRTIHYASVLKDRSTKLDGKTIKNPTFSDFLPHIECLSLGGTQVGTTSETSESVIPPDSGEGRLRNEQREIALDEIKELLAKHYPGQSADAKRTKGDLLEKHLDSRSWTRICTYGLEPLRAGRDALWQELEGHSYDWEEPAQESEIPF